MFNFQQAEINRGLNNNIQLTTLLDPNCRRNVFKKHFALSIKSKLLFSMKFNERYMFFNKHVSLTGNFSKALNIGEFTNIASRAGVLRLSAICKCIIYNVLFCLQNYDCYIFCHESMHFTHDASIVLLKCFANSAATNLKKVFLASVFCLQL